MTKYTDLIELLREHGDEVYSTRKKWLIADVIEALVKEADLLERRKECWQRSKDAAERKKLREQCAQSDINYGLEKADHERTKEELAALRKQIDELEPVAWHFSGKPLYLLDGIKK